MDYAVLTESAADADKLFAELTRQLVAAERWHELFEARLVEARTRLGVDPASSPHLEDLAEPIRTQLENDYTAACQEVGGLLVQNGRLREAWQYLRPAADKQAMHAALSSAVPSDENIEELIELALYEGIDTERGYGWLLGHYGTCNAITTLEGLAPQMPPADLRACAAVLVRHVDGELRENLGGHIEHAGKPLPPDGSSVREIIGDSPWLVAGDSIHIDASHLAATVRFARVLTEDSLVDLALQLAEYGAKLDESLQYAGDPPFEDLYPAHVHFFRGTLGNDIDQAVNYFRTQAEACDIYEQGTAPLETLLVMLDRAGDAASALKAYQQLAPTDCRLSPFAPRMIDLAVRSGDWELYEEILQQRDDPVGLAIGRLTREREHAD